MATEAPQLVDGGQVVASTDFRNSAQSGTTRLGPSGSAQFLAVQLSTTVDRTVSLTTANGAKAYGVLQNKPATGDAAAVCIFGVGKAVAGSSSIVPGQDLMADSSGALQPYSSAAGVSRIGRSLEAATAVGQVFTAVIYGAGMGGGSIA